MAKWKLLHVVGGEGSVWRTGQLAAQFRLLPDELFDQTIAAGEERVARAIENQTLQKAMRLGRRVKIELTAARNLRVLLRRLDPDLVVCWDVQATEQLKLVRLGSRRKTAGCVMLFYPQENRELRFKLKSNFHALGLHLVCGSDRLAAWSKNRLAAESRVHRVYPVFERTAQGVDKSALRKRIGLDPDTICVFVPTEGWIEDVHQAFIGCGIVERVNPKIRIVIADGDEDRRDRCRQFVERVIVPRILHVIEGWDPRLVLGACDAVIQPVSRWTETLPLLESFGRSVPVISSPPAEPGELFVSNETYWNLGKPSGRAVATGLYKLLNEPDLQNKLTTSARERVLEHCADGAYRAAMVKLYQRILSPRKETVKG